ncbi:MAG: DNA repair protein RadA [Turicibacter sp.]|nr:DNA repair protein RadA [Turicibacter sp.]
MPRTTTKTKTAFFCQECGTESIKWVGKCPGCGEWNTMVEELKPTKAQVAQEKRGFVASVGMTKPQRLKDIETQEDARIKTSYSELNRVLGGGIVKGSLVLCGGEPGIGKSTLLLQTAHDLATKKVSVLYVSGEESARQIKLRAERLGALDEELYIYAETDLTLIERQIQQIKPQFVIIDSIQTIHMPDVTSAPGSISQVRECTGQLMKLAKLGGISIFIVGHVTKEGNIAGPRLLEHMVDTVLYFEGDRHHTYRILRAVKNRFGSTNEIGIFDMKEEGLAEVVNASEVFLEDRSHGLPGTAIMASIEGTRPILVEIQSLLTPTNYGNPKRMASGVDNNKVSLILAVLEKRMGFFLQNQDSYLKVTGGVKLDEPAVDLAVVASIVSSYKDKTTPSGDVYIGEVGLTGEIRRVSRIEDRVKEAQKLGFTRAIVPKKNLSGWTFPDNMEIVGVDTIAQAVKVMFSE